MRIYWYLTMCVLSSVSAQPISFTITNNTPHIIKILAKPQIWVATQADFKDLKLIRAPLTLLQDISAGSTATITVDDADAPATQTKRGYKKIVYRPGTTTLFIKTDDPSTPEIDYGEHILEEGKTYTITANLAQAGPSVACRSRIKR